MSPVILLKAPWRNRHKDCLYMSFVPNSLKFTSCCHSDAGMCLPTDEGGGWICGNKGIKGKELKEVRRLRVNQCQVRVPTEPIMCVDLPWVSCHCQLCHTLGMEASGDWSERAEEKESPSQAWTVQPVHSQIFRQYWGAALAREIQLSEKY